jgi:hypothetical protein
MTCLDCGEFPEWVKREPDYRHDHDLHPEIFITPFPAEEQEILDGYRHPFAQGPSAIAPGDVEG